MTFVVLLSEIESVNFSFRIFWDRSGRYLDISFGSIHSRGLCNPSSMGLPSDMGLPTLDILVFYLTV